MPNTNTTRDSHGATSVAGFVPRPSMDGVDHNADLYRRFDEEIGGMIGATEPKPAVEAPGTPVPPPTFATARRRSAALSFTPDPTAVTRAHAPRGYSRVLATHAHGTFASAARPDRPRSDAPERSAPLTPDVPLAPVTLDTGGSLRDELRTRFSPATPSAGPLPAAHAALLRPSDPATTPVSLADRAAGVRRSFVASGHTTRSSSVTVPPVPPAAFAMPAPQPTPPAALVATVAPADPSRYPDPVLTPPALQPAPRPVSQPAPPIPSTPPVVTPVVYQLGRPVATSAGPVDARIESRYVPPVATAPSTAPVPDISTISPIRKEPVIRLFETDAARGRAHERLGSETFRTPLTAPPRRALAEMAERVTGNLTDEQAAAFLDEGTITFAEPARGTAYWDTIAGKAAPAAAPKKKIPSAPNVTYPLRRPASRPVPIPTAVAPIPPRSQTPQSSRLPAPAAIASVSVPPASRHRHETPHDRASAARPAVPPTPPLPPVAPALPSTPAPHRRRTKKKSPRTRRRRWIAWFVVLLALGVFAASLAQRGISLYSDVSHSAEQGFRSLKAAVVTAKASDFASSQRMFSAAQQEFATAGSAFDSVNGGVVALTQYVPLLSKVASGKSAVAAGEQIAVAGSELTAAAATLSATGDPLDGRASLLDLFRAFDGHLKAAHDALAAAAEHLDSVRPSDIPTAQQQEFADLRGKLPVALAALGRFRDNSGVIADILGANGPRKYLFLFQNNHEMRATGGFIGSYGRMDIADGRIVKFFIDGIFNPDGQLYEKVIPPMPIQKISAAWSLHDSNWFPDFPTSAEEAIVFYERTENPTVDGVIAITPTVLQELLRITGPVAMPQYDTVIDADNLMERLQQEVEVDYDKTENKPKKILSDLAPMVMERLLAGNDRAGVTRMLDTMTTMLAERHILLYARNRQLQALIEDAGWSGRIEQTDGDYLAVINTNINGYKTDGVVKETITHQADIQADGSVVDTVRIVRRHDGGHTPYEWWNKVNADYMRVYVPEGSELLSVSGQTREFVTSPLDYAALGFQADPRVVAEEQGMHIDDMTGTRTYVQNGKTVFANWVYVSPQETVTVEYKYRLPLRVDPGQGDDAAATYKVYFQKQSGSIGSTLESVVTLPDTLRVAWHTPQDASAGTPWRTDLRHDRLRGIVVAPQK